MTWIRKSTAAPFNHCSTENSISLDRNIATQGGCKEATLVKYSIAKLVHGPGIDCVIFTGIIDANAAQELKSILVSLLAPVADFDFTNVERIDSMGVALLFRLFKDFREDRSGEIRFKGLNQPMLKLFTMTGIMDFTTTQKAVHG
jgi:anti-anti-sigma factor